MVGYLDQYSEGFFIKRISIKAVQTIGDIRKDLVFGKRTQNTEFLRDYCDMILKRGKYTSASYTKKLQGIFDDYAILSPSTDKHCLISSVFMGVKKKKKINEDVKNYIKKYQIKNVVSTLENLAENLCEHFQINILAITARDFEEVLFKCKGQTENTELIKILIFGAHSYALLDKKYGVKSDIINEYRKPELIEEVKEEKNKYEDYEFATYDFETCDDENKNAHPYALGFHPPLCMSVSVGSDTLESTVSSRHRQQRRHL